MERRDEFGNPIRSTDEEEYERTTGYRAGHGPEGYGPYGTTGYGVSTSGLHNQPESGGQQQQMRPGQQRGSSYEQSGQQQQMRPGQQTGPGSGQTESGQQAGFGYGQTGFGSTGQTGYRQEGGRKEN